MRSAIVLQSSASLCSRASYAKFASGQAHRTLNKIEPCPVASRPATRTVTATRASSADSIFPELSCSGTTKAWGMNSTRASRIWVWSSSCELAMAYQCTRGGEAPR